MIQKWDERYKGDEFAYGKAPNAFFKEQLSTLEPGAILMPADGEGRNGVFAAQSAWKVTSCDFSKKHIEYARLDPKVGGQMSIDALFSKEEILADFENYEVILLEEEEILLNEGQFHNGKGSVIRFIGRKNPA